MQGLLILTTLAAVEATSATAQTWRPYQPPYASYPGGAAAAIADQHRYENDRLRNQAQASAALARQQQLETQIRRRQIEAARQPSAPILAQPRPLYSTEQERVLREGAAERRARTSEGVSQIDDWLDRPR
jgi:hypothetical protein